MQRSRSAEEQECRGALPRHTLSSLALDAARSLFLSPCLSLSTDGRGMLGRSVQRLVASCKQRAGRSRQKSNHERRVGSSEV